MWRPTAATVLRCPTPALRTHSARPALLALIVAALLLLALGPATARAAELGVVPDLTWYTSEADQDRTGAALTDVGARWVRLHVQWKEAEPSRGSYDGEMLAHYDRAVDVALRSGSKVLILAYNAPAWASGSSDRNTPRNPADFAAFMHFLAQRYSGRVAAYEIWNEQNIARFWNTGSDPVAYTALLKAANASIKSADPSAKVVFGGLSYSDWQYVERAYAAGARGHFDVMGTHPYTYCGQRDPEVVKHWEGHITEGSFVAYREIRRVMLAHDDPKPLWFTEFGWSTATTACNPSAGVTQGGVSEETQADYLAKALRIMAQDPYVEVALWYNFRNNWWSRDADRVEARYGLLRSDYSPKPAYSILKGHAGTTASGSPAAAVAAPQRTRRSKNHTRTTVALHSGTLASRSGARRKRRARRSNARFLQGTVAGATTGRVSLALERYDRRRHTWRRRSTERAALDGRGRYRERLGASVRRGRWRVRASYGGSAESMPSRSRLLHFRLR